MVDKWVRSRSGRVRQDDGTYEKIAMKAFKHDEANGLSRDCLREIAALKHVGTHAYLVHMIGVYTEEANVPIMVMQVMQDTLATTIKRHPRGVCFNDANRIYLMLRSGISHLHSHGFMHRDLKPQNILCNDCASPQQCSIMIADMGMACRYIPGRSNSLPVQTLYFACPEVVLEKSSYDPAIDYWSIGAIYLLLVTGNYGHVRCFTREEQLQVIFRLRGTPTEATWKGVTQLPKWSTFGVRAGQHLPLQRLRLGVSYTDEARTVVDQIINACLELDPRKRYMPDFTEIMKDESELTADPNWPRVVSHLKAEAASAGTSERTHIVADLMNYLVWNQAGVDADVLNECEALSKAGAVREDITRACAFLTGKDSDAGVLANARHSTSYDRRVLFLDQIERKGFRNVFKLSEEYVDVNQIWTNASDVSFDMRITLLDWLLEVTVAYDFEMCVFQLSASLIDAYISIHHTAPRKRLQLVGIACFWIASRLYSQYDVETKDVVDFCAHTFSKADVYDMQRSVCSALEYNLYRPTILDWISSDVPPALTWCLNYVTIYAPHKMKNPEVAIRECVEEAAKHSALPLVLLPFETLAYSGRLNPRDGMTKHKRRLNDSGNLPNVPLRGVQIRSTRLQDVAPAGYKRQRTGVA